MKAETELPPLKKLSLEEWLLERIETTKRIANTKQGVDRLGWIEDGVYLRLALSAVLRDKRAKR